METSEDALASTLIGERATSTDGYLSAPHTLQWFRSEFFVPSNLIDRGSRREFEEQGNKDTAARARAGVERILLEYTPREFDPEKKKEIDRIIQAHAEQHSCTRLPVIEII
jgi:trimethylamine:corrinoid methyltransferase-like protein